MPDLNENEMVLLGTSTNADVNEDLEIEIIEDDELEEITVNGVRKRIFRRKPRNKRVKIEQGANKRRLQVLERVGQLKAETKTQLFDGKMQLSDKTLYSVMAMSDLKDGKLIKSDAGYAVGERNLSQGKYAHDFLLQEIVVLYDDTSKTGTFDLDLPVAIANGELSILNNTRHQIDSMPVASIGSTNGYPIDKRFNSYKLDNPKWFKANTDIQANLSLSEALTDGFVKILLIGTEIRPL